MRTKLKFKDFTTLESYCKLQEHFVFMDYRNGFYEKIKEPFNDKTIIYNDATFDGDENFQEVAFIDGFLKPNISVMHRFNYSYFIKEINDKSLLTEELRSGLANKYIQKIRVTTSALYKSEYLNPDIILELEKQLKLIEEKIEEFLVNPYPEIKRKIQFKWSRTDVIYFFHLLRENKEINEISNADLGKIIDFVCECSKGEDFFDINGSSKHLSDFKTTSGRSETKAIERLSAIFNEDFFNV